MGRTIIIAIALAVLFTAVSQATANRGVGEESVVKTYQRIGDQIQQVSEGVPIRQVVFYTNQDEQEDSSDEATDKENEESEKRTTSHSESSEKKENQTIVEVFLENFGEVIKGVASNGESLVATVQDSTQDGVNIDSVIEVVETIAQQEKQASTLSNNEDNNKSTSGGSSEEVAIEEVEVILEPHCILTPNKKTYTCTIIEDVSFEFLEDGTIRVEFE